MALDFAGGLLSTRSSSPQAAEKITPTGSAARSSSRMLPSAGCTPRSADIPNRDSTAEAVPPAANDLTSRSARRSR